MAASVADSDARQFAAYSCFAQTPNYIDSGAPPVKFQFLPRFKIVVRSRWIAKMSTAAPNRTS
jgi:hypothetical protein